jgi:hypothetical protein
MSSFWVYELLELAVPGLTVIKPLRTMFILLLQNNLIKTLFLLGEAEMVFLFMP